MMKMATIQGCFFYRYEREMVLRAHRSIYRHAVTAFDPHYQIGYKATTNGRIVMK